MYNYTGYGMNPYQQQLTQNRIAQMEQQYNYQQPYMQNQSQTQMLKGRPVSSYDEAKASMIDLDGSLFVFTDIANGCIYTKQILLDGSAELKTYILKPTENKVNIEYVSKQQFENVVSELKQRIKELKEGVAYVQKLSKQMMQNNPLFKRAEEMAQGKSEQELEQVARNLCKQRGIDIEQAYKQFQAFMGGMNR